MTNIGVFDSGLGGLTVLSKLSQNLNANYFYFGDSLRAPYGSRSKNEIIKFSEEIIDFLEQFDIDKYVIACNTISVLATDYLKEKYKKEFIPITKAGVDLALENEGDFFVLATKTTVDSHFYKKNIESQKNSKVYEVAGANLVSLIENGHTYGDELDYELKNYLEIANAKKIPNIILGCTHFPIISEAISDNLTYDVNILNPADKIINEIKFETHEKSKINIFMSEVNDESKKIIDSLIDKDYRLEIKEL